MKQGVFFLVLAMVLCVGFGSAQAKEKEFVTINGHSYLRCQPVSGYSGAKFGAVATGRENVWVLIKMDPAATWNKEYCVAKENELIMSGSVPVMNKVCGNPIVDYKYITTITTVTNNISTKKQYTCDERASGGRVPEAVLAQRPNGADYIEILYRPNKDEAFKAKRYHANPLDRKGHPRRWENGKCMRIYSTSPISNTNVKGIMYPGDRATKLMESDGKTPFTDHGGEHDTIAVLIIDPS